MTNQIQSVRGRVMRHANRYMLMGLLIAGVTWANGNTPGTSLPLSSRHDVLVFQTQPLDAPMQCLTPT